MKMSKLIGIALGTLGSVAMAEAPSQVTFTKDVLPILQRECQTCHRPLGLNMSGMIAPMSLMDYKEARPWAKSIARVVESREMPPWHASEEFNGVFQNERTLTEDEIATITSWVEQGAKRGNPKDAPEAVAFNESGWNLGEPDLVVSFPEPFFVEDDIADLYHNVVVQLDEEQLPKDRWIQSLEFKPGSEVVHHIIGYASAPGEEAEQGLEGTRGMLGGNAPGTDVAVYPDGFGIKLAKGSQLTFAMHYHKESGTGTGVWDNSQMGFKFHSEDANIQYPVDITTIAHGAFEIPPHHDSWKVGASRLFKEDTLLLSMMPHLHLRGKAAKYTAYYPDGTTEVLLDVPVYDFNWQTQYDLTEQKLIPKGTRVEMEFWYDNSDERAVEVGFNPERAIRFGGPTTDEMDLAWITIAPAHSASATEHGQLDERTGD